MKLISVKVPDDIKTAMAEIDLNWSEVIREAITNRLKKEKLRRAVETQDSLRKKTSGKWSSTKEIRQWRERI